MRLINSELENLLGTIKYGETHGANSKNLGAGLLYYSLAYIHKFQECICIGSGSGFVPSILKQAQRDLGLDDANVILIDADLEDEYHGKADYHDLSQDSFLIKNYRDVDILLETSNETWKRYKEKNYIPFLDYVHIDGDPKYISVKNDFYNWFEFLKVGGYISIHDTDMTNDYFGSHRVLKELMHVKGKWQWINFNLGNGVALFKKL